MATRSQSGCCAAPLEPHLDPEMFRALGDPVRLTLVARLATSPAPLTVGAASECCGVHLSGVSRHLAILRRAGVVTAHKRGREVLYHVAARPLIQALRGLADALEACCGSHGCCEGGPTDDHE